MSEYVVNRFPVCAVAYYGMARKKGYDVNQAKALGLAVAIFFAAAKRGVWRGHKIRDSKKSNGNKTEQKELKRITLYDRVFKSEDGIYPKLGEKIITEKDFDKEIQKKFKDKSEKILKYAEDYMKQFKEISNPFEIYKSIRDEWRTKEFLEHL